LDSSQSFASGFSQVSLINSSLFADFVLMYDIEKSIKFVEIPGMDNVKGKLPV